MQSAEYFTEKADQCYRLARFARSADSTKFEVATTIEGLGNEFIAKAVELETVRQKIMKRSTS
jgi:hypothetical protein